MVTMTTMVTVTGEQWLELHLRTLDCVRAVLRDLTTEQLLWEPETARDATRVSSCLEPRPFSIGGIVAHLCGAEMHWLGQVDIRAKFAAPRPADWNPRTLAEILGLIEEQYHGVLKTWAKDRHVLFGLGRVCQHNLYHLAQLVHLRTLQQPKWQPPAGGESGSWEHAANYITDLLIFGDKATRTVSKPRQAPAGIS